MIALRRLILFAVCWFIVAPALAEKRVALVIGNSAYRHAPALPNPKNDAEAMAASLRRLNFEVFAGTDLDKPAMERLLRRFTDAAEKADVALAFYAGHGLQVHGRNYLVPVDARLDKESDLRFDAVPLEDVQSLMEMGSRINILILDACRDNPLARNLARNMGTRSTAIGRGLGETKAGIGTLIVYATQPGNVALDGDEKNSPFTTALLKYIEAPGLEIRQVLTRVRNDVITSTRDKQVPWDSSSLRGDFYFVAGSSQPGTTPATPQSPNLVQPPAQIPTPAAPVPVPPPPAADNEALFWQTIKDSRNIADFRAYLARYPNGTFSELAKIRIADLEKPAVVTPPPPERTVTPPPAPPPLRRVSTFERNTFISGDTLVSARIVANVQACAASCVANRQCVSWIFLHSTSGCIIHNKMHSKSANAEWTSGVIRVARDTQPGTTPAAPPAPPPVRTTPPAQDLVREVMRKAQAGEVEAGFCARSGWPIYRSAHEAAGPHEREQVGTTRVFQHLYGTQGCGFGRTVSVAFENGRRCVRNAWWQCLIGAKCNYAIYKFCKSDQGTYDYVP